MLLDDFKDKTAQEFLIVHEAPDLNGVRKMNLRAIRGLSRDLKTIAGNPCRGTVPTKSTLSEEKHIRSLLLGFDGRGNSSHARSHHKHVRAKMFFFDIAHCDSTYNNRLPAVNPT